jgi:hypothetical protein
MQIVKTAIKKLKLINGPIGDVVKIIHTVTEKKFRLY